MASTFVPLARSGWAKPVIRLAPSKARSASVLLAPPIDSFAFTSVAIPSSAAPRASSSPARPARHRRPDNLSSYIPVFGYLERSWEGHCGFIIYTGIFNDVKNIISCQEEGGVLHAS